MQRNLEGFSTDEKQESTLGRVLEDEILFFFTIHLSLSIISENKIRVPKCCHWPLFEMPHSIQNVCL